MALQKDTVSVSLATSVNQKTDSRVLDAGQMSSVKDYVFDKDGQLVKRFGQTSLSTTVVSSFTNPLTIATSNYKTKTFAHENQLCQVNNGALYSQMQGQNEWLFKGHLCPVGITTASVSGVAYTDTATVSGITVLVAGNDSAYCVREDSTGNILVLGSLSRFMCLVAFSNSIWVVCGVPSTTNVTIQRVSLVDGSLGSPITLLTDCPAVNPYGVSVTVTSASSPIGEMAFIAYKSTGNVKVVPFDSTGTIPALGALNTGSALTSTNIRIYCEPSVAANKLFLVLAPASVYLGVWTFTSGAYTTVLSPTSIIAESVVTSINPYTQFRRTTMAINPVNNTELYVFVDTNYRTPVGLVEEHSLDSSLYYAITNLSGAVTTSATVYGYGYELVGTAIRDAGRKTIYLPCIVYSPLQNTYILVDILKGNTGKTTYVIGKWGAGLAEETLWLCPCLLTSASGSTYRFVNNGNLIDISLSNTYAPQSQYLAGTTHVTGGILWAYDGSTLSEHGHLFYPEITSLFIGKASLGLTVNTVGDASHKEKWTLTLQQGGAFYGGAGGGTAYGHLRFNTTLAGYYLWFKVDGSGTDPAPAARTGIECDILSTDTVEEVTSKVTLAISNAGIGGTQTVAVGSIIYENSAVGAVTAPSLNGNYTTSTGGLSAGSYKYCAVFKWTDRNGHIYRSAPSVAQVAVAAANDFASFLVWCPLISNKTAVGVEIYRSLVDGDTFQLVTTDEATAPTVQYYAKRIEWTDFTADTDIDDNEFIYTNGGVLENDNIGACTALSSFKNRLLVTKADDPTEVFYSRTNISGDPVNFSNFNLLPNSGDGAPVTAHAQMDDKLVISKEKATYVTGGDGGNDLGQNASFQLPMKIPGDIGVLNPNSVILSKIGLMFQSAKGLYVLTRGLTMEYVGAAVDDYKTAQVSSAVLAANFDHIIFGLQDQTISLVYNQLLNRWDFWTAQQGDSACLWQGSYARALNSGKVFVESATNYYDYDGSKQSFNPYIETAWLKLKGLEGFQRVYHLMLLGEYKTAHSLTFELLYDYVTTTSTTYTFDASTIATDPPYQVEVQPARQKCQSIKIKITQTPSGGTEQGAIFNVLEFEVGLKGGLYRIKSGKST